jgi:hypothetical protein
LADVPGVELYSLQVGAGRDQLSGWTGAKPIRDLAGALQDFADTAAIMSQLHLVVSCDSAPAHLAGALAMPVWLPVPKIPDWRWLLEREDSPWYPTLRLFRQQTLGDWSGAFSRMVEPLRELVEKRVRGASAGNPVAKSSPPA